MVSKQNPEPIREADDRMPPAGRILVPDLSDRARDDVSRGITPAKVDRIMRQADSGNASEQAELAQMILEKNHTVAAAFGVRRNAVLGLKWHIEPGDPSEEAAQTARLFEKELQEAGAFPDTESFSSLLDNMLLSLITGYSMNEILWGTGGHLLGFSTIPARDLDFMNSLTPKIRLSDTGTSMEPERNKFIFAHCRMHGSDPVRGGLIRPLAWLHCFSQLNIKDLLRFVESYGMPFILAKVSNETFANERNELLRMIKNFGSSGGGLVTLGTEIVPVQAPNTSGDVYFRMLEFLDDAVIRLILGQTATSGDGGGFSKNNAQDKVRQDILEADAEFLADVINVQLAVPWSRFNAGTGAAVPKFRFDTAPAEDKEKLAGMLKTLFDSGFEADAEEISERFGLRLRKRMEDAR